MKTELEIRQSLAEAKGELQRLCNKDVLDLEMSPEEYDAIEQYYAEVEALEWVLGDSA